MRYPTIAMACDAMRSMKRAFRTLKSVVVATDEIGEPIFRASSRSVRFNVTIDGVPRAIRIFTARVDLSLNQRCELLKGELLIAGENGADYYDIVVEEPFTIKPVQGSATIEIHENRARVCRADKWGFTNAAGSVVIEPIYDLADDFSEGRAVVCLDGKYGLIDPAGNVIIEPIYDDLSYDGSHLCYTERDGLFGVCDRMGNIISDNQWDWVGEFADGMLLVELGGKYGFIDLAGEVAIEIKYDDATSFDHNGYSTVRLGGRSYQIDKEEFRV